MSDHESSNDEFDDLDRQLVTLIQRRARLAKDRLGSNASLAGQTAADASRIDQLLSSVDGEIERESLTAILRHISRICIQQVQPTCVAYLGPEHSYSHLATLKYFGEGVQLAPVASIPAVFESVTRCDATTGLVPIENSTDGRIVDTLGMFVRQSMQICGEVLLPIHHNLLSRTPRDQITEVHSKPQALSQCREWLATNMPAAAIKEISSTTAAAKLAAETPGVAAVASIQAAQQYGLDVVNANIEDNKNNVTRFAVLGRDEPAPSGDDKTSLLFQVNHEPGALANVMNVFKAQGLNLTWIESFPAPDSPNEYLFFVELTGHLSEPAVSKTIDILTESTQRLDVLGSYPRARLS